MSESMIENVADAIRKAEGCTAAPVAQCDYCKADRGDSCKGMARAAIDAIGTAGFQITPKCKHPYGFRGGQCLQCGEFAPKRPA